MALRPGTPPLNYSKLFFPALHTRIQKIGSTFSDINRSFNSRMQVPAYLSLAGPLFPQKADFFHSVQANNLRCLNVFVIVQ